MKGDIPVFKRCCFCVPLRYGLLGWAYVRMTADALVITLMTYAMLQTVLMARVYRDDDEFLTRALYDMIAPAFIVAVFIADFIATILFIVGGHKKNVRLMRVFFFISIAMLIFTLLNTAISVVLIIQNWTVHNMHFWKRTMMVFSFYFVALAVQTYFLILLRSEIIKLSKKGEFRFVNNAAEVECTMKYEEIVTGEETNTADA